jgi:N-methylhydantoinase B
MQFLTDGTISVEGDGHSHEPWGFLGGANGRTSHLELVRANGKTVSLPSMLASVPVARGDRVRAVGGIGGGYGPAFERDPERVLADVLDGYLTRKAAKRDFGVAITPRGRINRAATAKLRAAAPL